MVRILIILLVHLPIIAFLNAQPSRMAISARVAETSMMYFVLPITWGLTMGPSLEYRITKKGYLGAGHSFGYTVGIVTNYRLHDSEFYYYLNNYRVNIINQAGFRYTACEVVKRQDYQSYGDRIHAWGVFVGNNRISFFKDYPRLVFGIQFSVTVAQRFERHVKYTMPTSFLFLSLRYMLNSETPNTSKYKIHE
jgi:hypothetical protein